MIALVASAGGGDGARTAAPPTPAPAATEEVEMPAASVSADVARLRARAWGADTGDDVVRALVRLGRAPTDAEIPLPAGRDLLPATVGQRLPGRLPPGDPDRARPARRRRQLLRARSRVRPRRRRPPRPDPPLPGRRHRAGSGPHLEEVVAGRWRREVKSRASAPSPSCAPDPGSRRPRRPHPAAAVGGDTLVGMAGLDARPPSSGRPWWPPGMCWERRPAPAALAPTRRSPPRQRPRSPTPVAPVAATSPPEPVAAPPAAELAPLPAPEPPPPPPMITLTITSKPAGASVFVGGELRGKTPLRLEVPGDGAALDLKVTRKGYVDEERTIEAEADAVVAFDLAKPSKRPRGVGGFGTIGSGTGAVGSGKGVGRGFILS
ncbi:MAG: PEGA domain-containing protein [Kofleriaceae bacterium]|nr:PEGA domain-containing protein [Kofleriaceae bacterium]